MFAQESATLPNELQYIIQLGGFGLAAYLVWWLTKKINGKFDRLADSVEKLNDNIEHLVQKFTEDHK